jgi:hypothetical protein
MVKLWHLGFHKFFPLNKFLQEGRSMHVHCQVDFNANIMK